MTAAGPRKPHALKKPLRRRKDGSATIKVTGRTADVLDRPDSILEWDEEELRRGYRRDKNGNFTGRPPSIVPAECHQELMRRQLRWAQDELRNNLKAAMEALAGIVKSPNADDHAKMKAISLILDRTLGKVPDRVEMAVETPPWMEALKDGIIVGEEEDFIEAESEEVVKGA